MCLLFKIINSNQNNSFFKENLELIKTFPAKELTSPDSQDSASSDNSFRLELLPSQESFASDSPIE